MPPTGETAESPSYSRSLFMNAAGSANITSLIDGWRHIPVLSLRFYYNGVDVVSRFSVWCLY